MTDEAIESAEILWDYHRIADPPVRSDFLLGLGSYDTRVAERCARLLAEGWAPVVVFTGAEGNFTRGRWERSEAETFAEVAIAAGADPARILIEPKATNTGENVRLSRALLEVRSLARRSAILVSKPNMNRRGLATCQQHWPELAVRCNHPETHFLHSPAPGHTPEEVVHEIVGDLQRILEYPELGFQAEQEVPPEVLAAYARLVELGFTGHLLD